MNTEKLMNDLKKAADLIPDEYDGSYKLAQSIIQEYRKMESLSNLTNLDLNAVYGMVIGTWKHSIEKKKEYISRTHLSDESKQQLYYVLDDVWDRACRNQYQHNTKSFNEENADPNSNYNKPIVGMFGTGFYSFSDTSNEDSIRFIQMCVDIYGLDDDYEIYDRCEKTLSNEIKGIGSATASVILHCLKPYTFPIINGNYIGKPIFPILGVTMEDQGIITSYIENCRRIKEFRDTNFGRKNYRVFDVFSLHLSEYEETENSEDDEGFGPSLDKYNPGLSKELLKSVLINENVFERHWLKALYQMYLYGGTATCKQLEIEYGMSAGLYRTYLTAAGARVAKYFHLPLMVEDERTRRWCVLLFGKYADTNTPGSYVWRMRPELYKAIEELEEEGALDGILENEKKDVAYPLNQILYGPPGTGKTYHTAAYAVAICDNKKIEDVKKWEYSKILNRYDELKEEGRVAFTTFHQSYGYEEFIEGIKPRLEENEIGYVLENGIFKEMCLRAKEVKIKSSAKDLISTKPNIWGMLLDGPGESQLKTECFTEGCVRLGFSEYKDNALEHSEVSAIVKKMIIQFRDEMQKGDIVLIERTNHSIDAIGIITGEYEYDESDTNGFPRRRKVDWLFTGKEINIVPFLPNNQKMLSRFFVFNFNSFGLNKIMEVLEEAEVYSLFADEEKMPYVFIIDEINRGNISKIFGELITLIEETKRSGAHEAAEAILPYSGDTFSVPSNLYILGTMNTADRSIALMDTALRRRFSFVEMMPDTKVLKNLGIDIIESDGITVDIAQMLETINRRIEFLYDREHTIGHAYFTKLKDDCSLSMLSKIFRENVIPLLQEYFYEDYEKIQLVLGDNAKSSDENKFILDKSERITDIFNGSPDIEPEKQYYVQESAFDRIESYKEIGKKQ